ncbi:MAG: Phosphoserine transaminase [Trizodia sp. TS-e1964]|nr:MAG: Phosphoserine transaminase [Trizodia sp. TS-e1964]
MPVRTELTYFGAGPAALPTSVLETASQALLDYNGSGLGLVELSHRSPTATQILSDSKERIRSILEVPEDYEILFMQGGGTAQFSATIYNLVSVWVERRRRRAEKELSEQGLAGETLTEQVLQRLKTETAQELKLDYLVTGSWSLKASQEAARLLGEEHVNIATDSRKENSGKFGHISPEETWKLTQTRKQGGPGAAFVYYCDNETVDGVEFPKFPAILESHGGVEEDESLVIADMSSNILSRKVDVKKFAVIFAGAQKNVGTTGLTIVILRKSLLPPSTATSSPALLRKLGLPIGPIVLDYPIISKNNSVYNTLSIFDVWVAGEVIAGLLKTHGDAKLTGQEVVAGAKAKLIYDFLEQYPDVYHVVPEKSVRSRMNICFRVGEDGEVEKLWLKGAEERNLLGLKGHRSVGGIRASNYNSIPLEGAEKLALYIKEFAESRNTA